ncbi:MAG: molybdopterin-dependent oxidoreductase, partial [Dehalococcoidia bacterium]
MSIQRRVKTEEGTTIVRTSAPLTCGPGCGILAHVKDGVLLKVEPGDFPETGHLCARGMGYPQWVYHPDRLKYPMKRVGERGEGKWERVSWEEALEIVASRFKEIGQEYGSASVAWMVGGGALGALTASAVMGAAGACGGTFVLPLGMGDSAGPTGDKITYGTTLALGERYTVNFEQPALILVWGNNPAETDFFKWRRLMKAREKGARVVVIDPRFTTTASKADEYIPIKPGTDPALALGMLNVIIDRHLEDASFLKSKTVGPFLVRSDNGHFLKGKDTDSGETDKYMVWDTASGAVKTSDAPEAVSALTGEYRVEGIDCKPAFQLLADLVSEYEPDKVSAITGVPAETITRLADEYAERKPAASYRGMGLQRTFHGDHSWRAISTLAAVTGNISFDGYGGFEPNYAAFMTLGIPNLLPVLNMYEAILEGKSFPVRAVWMARHNMVNQLPDFNVVTRELLPRLEFIVTAEMFMSLSAQYSDIVLPACSFFECNDVVVPAGLGTHDYMQLQQEAIKPLHESRSDFDMLAGLVKAMGIEGFM